MISEAAIDELKASNPCDAVAAQWVRLRRGGKLGQCGPCPLHSPDPEARDSTAFECNAERWVCAVCQDGGDVIKLVALRHGLDAKRDFVRIIELLGGAAEPDAERAAQLAAARAANATKSAQDDNLYRAREQKAARAIYERGLALPGTPAERYLERRGLTALPAGLELRYGMEVSYFHGQEENEIGRPARRVIHRGPAMLAPIVDAGGVMRAVHMTWIDLDQPNGKAIIVDPQTKEQLPAKKVRGSKSGNLIRLWWPPTFSSLYLSEGIETGLAAWFLLHGSGRDLAAIGFAAAVDLGNLAGRAAKSVPHPELKTAKGRTRLVPGPLPDFETQSLAVPDAVSEIVLLGDGDSDRFTTECALARASARLNRASECVERR